MKNILVAIDFGPTSSRALDIARTLADALGASLHLVHVISSPLASSRVVEQRQREACARLDALLDSAYRATRPAIVRCLTGTPAHEIARYAAENAIDLIVIGTHSHGPTFRMTTGSIAETVLGMAPCAVLAVKGADEGAFGAALDPPPASVGI